MDLTAPSDIGRVADPGAPGLRAVRLDVSSQRANSVGVTPVAPAISSRGIWADPNTDDLLRSLWADGLTAQKIGERMGVTKNAIIGRAHRLQLPSRGSPMISAGQRVRRAAERAARKAQRELEAKMEPERVIERAQVKVRRRRAAPVTDGGCRFPMWGDKERPYYTEQRFCGEPRRDAGCSYCTAHAAICFNRAGAA